MQQSGKQSVRYSFTVTLKPRMYIDPSETQFDLTFSELRTILKSMNAKFTLIAELTKMGHNIHYHGTITFPLTSKNVVKRFIDVFRKTKHYGFVSIKQIDNEQGWIDYISKEFIETVREVERRPIINDDFNYFDEKLKALYSHLW